MKTKKELKDEYKQLKFPMGVFQIRNLNNGKIYLGSSLDLNAAWNSQRFQLEAGLHQNNKLQGEWKEFGAENFVYEIVDVIKQTDESTINFRKEIKLLEEMYIDELQPFGNKGYHHFK
jgi:hypothetical protein